MSMGKEVWVITNFSPRWRTTFYKTKSVSFPRNKHQHRDKNKSPCTQLNDVTHWLPLPDSSLPRPFRFGQQNYFVRVFPNARSSNLHNSLFRDRAAGKWKKPEKPERIYSSTCKLISGDFIWSDSSKVNKLRLLFAEMQCNQMLCGTQLEG